MREAKTLSVVYGRLTNAALAVFRERTGMMQGAMGQYKLVWQCKLSVKLKTARMSALFWNKGRWSLHLFPVTKKSLRTSIDGTQACFLRRILKVPAAYISRVSHQEIRRRSSKFRFSNFIFRAQLRWLGRILRTPQCVVC